MVGLRPRRAVPLSGLAPQRRPTRVDRPEAAPPLTLRSRLRYLAGFLRSTPGRLTSIGLFLISLCIGTGFVATQAISANQDSLDGLLNQSEPLAYSSQQLYSALSIADASANTAFISGGIEQPEVRDRYLQALADASASIVTAAGGIPGDSPTDRELLARLNVQLPVYAGLVETARTNNRSGYPVASAYLAEASAMMHDTLLPEAEQLYRSKIETVSTSHARTSGHRWGLTLLIAVLLLALIGTQVWLTRLTNRRLNIGLLVATVLIATMLAWVVAVGAATSRTGVDGVSRDARENVTGMEELTRARIAAQQARSEETLALVRREDLSAEESSFAVNARVVRDALEPRRGDGDTPAAHGLAALDGWEDAHMRMTGLLGEGDHAGAVAIATGPSPSDSTNRFQALDTALRETISSTRSDLREQIADSRNASRLLTGGVTNLVLVTTALIVFGFFPRLREYQ